jgi:hypothetical protein
MSHPYKGGGVRGSDPARVASSYNGMTPPLMVRVDVSD